MTEKTLKNIIDRRNFRTPSEKLAFALGWNDAMDNMKGENLVCTRVNNKLKRSNKLLRLYFGAWIRCIVEDCEGYCTKEKIEEYHEYIKTQLLPPEIIKIKTKKEIVEYNKPISLKTFNNSDMVKYMNKVQIFALEKWNIVLPLPEEKGYEQLVEKYKEWIK